MRRVPIDPEHIPSEPPDELELPPESSHYLRDVLRLSPGDPVELFDGEGRLLRGEVRELEPAVVIDVAEVVTDRSNESPFDITLLQSIPRGGRWETVLEKTTELGVRHIVPLQTARSVVRISGEKVERKLARWERVVASAARQSERSVTPDVVPPRTLDEAAVDRTEELQLVASPTAGRDLGAVLSEHTAVESAAIWVGPEGGLTDDEVERICDAAIPIRLGPRVLRSETAGIVVVALLQHAFGDLR